MTETTIDYKEKYEATYIELISLRHELDQLKRLVFGSKHERFIPATSPDQLSLGLPVEEVKACRSYLSTKDRVYQEEEAKH